MIQVEQPKGDQSYDDQCDEDGLDISGRHVASVPLSEFRNPKIDEPPALKKRAFGETPQVG
jgi:hypothetical protein